MLSLNIALVRKESIVRWIPCSHGQNQKNMIKKRETHILSQKKKKLMEKKKKNTCGGMCPRCLAVMSQPVMEKKSVKSCSDGCVPPSKTNTSSPYPEDSPTL
jgi:hypothetical protein